jgi:hypothetical protein
MSKTSKPTISAFKQKCLSAFGVGECGGIHKSPLAGQTTYNDVIVKKFCSKIMHYFSPESCAR